MTKEEKELLLKDLCGRLPYGVKVLVKDSDGREYTLKADYGDLFLLKKVNPNIKPYLRPMSSMTEEEKKELELLGWRTDELADNEPWAHCGDIYHIIDGIDWLNKKMFAYRTLDGKDMFELGIALEAPEGMYNIK